MTYIVIEIQKSAQGTVSTIVTQHAAVLLTDAGQEIVHQSYTHEAE